MWVSGGPGLSVGLSSTNLVGIFHKVMLPRPDSDGNIQRRGLSMG